MTDGGGVGRDNDGGLEEVIQKNNQLKTWLTDMHMRYCGKKD